MPRTETIWEADTYCGSNSETELNFEMKLQEANLLIKKVQQTLEDLGSNLQAGKMQEKSPGQSPKKPVKVPCAGKVRTGSKKKMSGASLVGCRKDICEQKNDDAETPRKSRNKCLCKNIEDIPSNRKVSKGGRCRNETCKNKKSAEKIPSAGKLRTCKESCTKAISQHRENDAESSPSKNSICKGPCKRLISSESEHIIGEVEINSTEKENKKSAEKIPSAGKLRTCKESCTKAISQHRENDAESSPSKNSICKGPCKRLISSEHIIREEEIISTEKEITEHIKLDSNIPSIGTCSSLCKKVESQKKIEFEHPSATCEHCTCCLCKKGTSECKKSDVEIPSSRKKSTCKGVCNKEISEPKKSDGEIPSSRKSSTCKCKKTTSEHKKSHQEIPYASKSGSPRSSGEKEISEHKKSNAEMSAASKTTTCKCKKSTSQHKKNDPEIPSSKNSSPRGSCEKDNNGHKKTTPVRSQVCVCGTSCGKEVSDPKMNEAEMVVDIRKKDKLGDEKVKFHKVMKIDYVETSDNDEEFVKELKEVSKNDEEHEDDVNVTFIEQETILFDSYDDSLEHHKQSEPKITIITEEHKDGVIVRVVKSDSPANQLPGKNDEEQKKTMTQAIDEKQTPQVVKNISDLEMFLSPAETTNSAMSLKQKISVHETRNDPYFNLVHEMKSTSEMPTPESKFKMFSVQALPQINLPGPYVLQRTLNLYIDSNGKSHNRIAKEANCEYIEARGFGDSAPSTSQLKPRCTDCPKDNCVVAHTQTVAQVSPGHSISGVFNHSTDIVNRVAQKFAMTHDVPQDNIDKDAWMNFQSYQVLREPGRKAAESKSQEQFEHESEAKNQKIVKEIINNISDKMKRKSESRKSSLAQRVVNETRSPVEMGFYVTKQIQCNLDESLPFLPLSTSTEADSDDDSIPVKDVFSREEERNKVITPKSAGKQSDTSSKIILGKNTSKNIQTSLKSGSETESSHGSLVKSKRSSRISKESHVSSDQSFYVNPALPDEGVERFYEELPPSTKHSSVSSRNNNRQSSGGWSKPKGESSNFDEIKPKEHQSDKNELTKLTMSENGESPYSRNSPKILTVFEKRTMPEGGECAIRNKQDFKNITKTWDKSMREIVKSPRYKVPKSTSFPVSLDESASEGELPCKCSLSIGEVHLCQHLNEIKRKQKIGIVHAGEDYKKQFNEQMGITRQRTQYNNWVTYFLQKEKKNNLPDDSSWSSSKSSDLDK